MELYVITIRLDIINVTDLQDVKPMRALPEQYVRQRVVLTRPRRSVGQELRATGIAIGRISQHSQTQLSHPWAVDLTPRFRAIACETTGARQPSALLA
jgi:hypothetical protein